MIAPSKRQHAARRPVTRIAACAAIFLFMGTTGYAAAQTANSDVDVNLNALGLQGGGTQPRLILKYPGSKTATREVPQLRYPNVPAPTQRPTPPAAKPAKVSGKPRDADQTAPAQPANADKPVKTPAKSIASIPAGGQARLQDAAPKAAKPPVEQPTNGPAGAFSIPAANAPSPSEEPREVAVANAPAAIADPVAQAPAAAAAPITPAPVAPAPAAPEASPQPAPQAAPEPTPQSTNAQPAQAQVASLDTPPPALELAAPEPAILRVEFDSDNAAIIGDARSRLDSIAETLRYDPRRIELRSFGGTPGDKTSNARRLSLKRGLAVRAYLMGLGIDSRRIDVRALGGVTDTGSPDRVDVTYSGG